MSRKRQARNEARLIRIRELERQQREADSESDRRFGKVRLPFPSAAVPLHTAALVQNYLPRVPSIIPSGSGTFRSGVEGEAAKQDVNLKVGRRRGGGGERR